MTEAKEKTYFSLDNSIKLVSFLGSIVIFFSIFKAYVFYATFGIQITSYISFSEAILLFLNEIAVLILFSFLIATLFAIVFYLYRLKFKNAKPVHLMVPGVGAPMLHKLICVGIYLYPLFYLLFAIVKGVRNYGNTAMFYFLLICFLFIELLIITFTCLKWKALWVKANQYSAKLMVFTIFSGIVFFYTWALGRQLALFHRNKINKEVIVTSNGKSELLTGNNIQFLGATSKYIFCYNISAGRSIVIDVSRFESVEFGSYANLPGFSVFDLLFH